VTDYRYSNIGNDAKALWVHYDETKDETFLVNRQQMHVSILSIGSFLGRLASGECLRFSAPPSLTELEFNHDL
jgi:hypothetical protein